MRKVLLLVCCISGLALQCANSRLCSTNSKPYDLFGTKTLYENVAGDLPNQRARAPKRCSPIFVYGLIRHGARYPGNDAVIELRKLKELTKSINVTGKATLCKKDLEAIRNWKIWTDEYNDSNLTAYGANEMKQLALRLQQFLPEILSAGRPASKFRFTSTESMRTIDSMEAFVESLSQGSFRDEIKNFTEIVTEEIDPINDENCNRYVREVDDNDNITEEYDKFVEGPIVTQMSRGIARRLGVPSSMITNDVVNRLYDDGCYSEQWVTGKNAPWCNVFSKKDLKLMEYGSDVEDYPERGYKFPVTYLQNCFLSKEIVNMVKKAGDDDLREKEQNVLARFRFAHTSNIVTLAANLNLYSDEPGPTADAFYSQQNRAFRMSYFSPSAANLVFVLYRCEIGKRTRYTVQVYWNEKLLKSYPACPSATHRARGMCNLETWLWQYRSFVAGSPTECNQEEICA
ncbi:multiple inositol polyphosphate phosphatase 1-like isoform X2 [Clavelina lepadiformis]|uniref:multiple inositol polyphosphate phosphatase 1-like isoform X2 n=1 Tax=Clavelina lepadiformis TaxID=159417 RepID=UPI0040431C61